MKAVKDFLLIFSEPSPCFSPLLFLHRHLSQCLPHCVPTLLFMALIRPLYISQNILSSFSLHHLSNATLVTSHLPCSLPPLTTVSVVSRGLPWRAISHTHTHPWSDCALSPTSSHVVKPQSSYILNRLSVFSSRFSRDSIYINISIQYDTEEMNKVTERCIGSDVRCYNMTHLPRQCTAWQLTYTQTHTHDLSCQKWP